MPGPVVRDAAGTEAEDRLVAGRARRGSSPDGMQRLVHHGPLGPGCSPRRRPRLRCLRARRPRRRPDRRRHRLREERGLLGRRPAAVHGHGWQDHELPAWFFLAYASPKGRALIDRELYLPRSWTGDKGRLAAAKVTEDTPVPDEAAAPAGDDRAGDRRGHPVRLGHGQRGLRRQRAAARLPQGTAGQLRAGCLMRPRHHGARGPPPRRRPGREAPEGEPGSG